METLKALPISFWISLIAVLVSMGSLILSYRNSRHSRQLDSLQRRSQLLFKLTEAKSKVLIAKLKLKYLKAALLTIDSHPLFRDQGALASSLPFFNEAFKTLKEMKETHLNLEKRVLDSENTIDRLWANCDKLTERTNAKEIERILPQAQHLQAGIDTVSTYIDGMTESLERSIKTLESIGKDKAT